MCTRPVYSRMCMRHMPSQQDLVMMQLALQTSAASRTVLKKVGTSQQKGKPTLFEIIDFLIGDFVEAIAGSGFDPQDLPGSFHNALMMNHAALLLTECAPASLPSLYSALRLHPDLDPSPRPDPNPEL